MSFIGCPSEQNARKEQRRQHQLSIQSWEEGTPTSVTPTLQFYPSWGQMIKVWTGNLSRSIQKDMMLYVMHFLLKLKFSNGTTIYFVWHQVINDYKVTEIRAFWLVKTPLFIVLANSQKTEGKKEMDLKSLFYKKGNRPHFLYGLPA